MAQYDATKYHLHNLYPLLRLGATLDEKGHSVQQALLTMQRYSWEQGVCAQALLELGETDLVVLMARDAVVRQDDKGRLGMMGDINSVTDAAANGEAVLFAAGVTGAPLFTRASQKMLDWLLHKAPRAGNGGLYHVVNQKQVWVDSFYMAPPFLAAAGYFDEAVKQIECLRHFLWNPEKKLYGHIWDDENQTFARSVPWGVGNGWAAAGLVRVIRTLPAEMKDEKMRLISYLHEVIDGSLDHLRDDGLFHDVLDDPSTFVETNTAQMLAYSIYHSVLHGWLSADYEPLADKMRNAAMQKVDKDGIVRGVCGAPTFDKEGSAPEGQAFYLLMEAAFQSALVKKREVSRGV